jgi:inner membrane protein
MDTLTHIALGACIGELFSDRKFVKKAMLWGALAQSIPDIDFISVAWLGPTEELIAHRGFTHSILFGILITFFLAVTAERFHRPHNISLKKWIFFLGTEVAVHLLIDAFNNYGVGWFEPFWDKRISLHTIFVVDPFFSIPSGIACLALLLLHTDHKHRIKWAGAGISLTVIYLLYALSNKSMVTSDIREIAQKQHIDYNSKRAFTTPTPFNTWLWFVVIEEKDGYQIGYRSLFDSDDSLKLNYFPRNEKLLDEVRDHKEVINLKKFSQGYYTVEKRGDTLVFNDLRFGQEVGWYDPTQPFAFHYYLSHPNDNELVVQRGRFAQWNETTIKSFLNRIGGY